MKRNFSRLWLIGLVTVVFSGIGWAQGDKNDRAVFAASGLYVISAKAGGVNFVSGKVSIDRQDAKSGHLLKGDTIEVGDKVLTGADGKAEILLNPGSYVRLAENSEFEFRTTALDDLQLKLNAGSSIFEVIADNDFRVTIDTPKSTFYLISSGVYRVDVTADGQGKLSVWKGKAQVGDINAAIVKGGKTAEIINGQVAVAKFDRDNKGDLENWSKSRAKEIAKVNEKLQQRVLTRSLVTAFSQNGWGNFNGYGVWVFDASRGYCFLPRYYGWSSPYGYGYNQSIWRYPAGGYYNNQNNNQINNPNNGQYPNGQNPGASQPVYTPPNNGGMQPPVNNGGGAPRMRDPDLAPIRPQAERVRGMDKPNN